MPSKFGVWVVTRAPGACLYLSRCVYSALYSIWSGNKAKHHTSLHSRQTSSWAKMKLHFIQVADLRGCLNIRTDAAVAMATLMDSRYILLFAMPLILRNVLYASWTSNKSCWQKCSQYVCLGPLWDPLTEYIQQETKTNSTNTASLNTWLLDEMGDWFRMSLTLRMLGYHMLKYLLKCAPAGTFSGYFNNQWW